MVKVNRCMLHSVYAGNEYASYRCMIYVYYFLCMHDVCMPAVRMQDVHTYIVCVQNGFTCSVCMV